MEMYAENSASQKASIPDTNENTSSADAEACECCVSPNSVQRYPLSYTSGYVHIETFDDALARAIEQELFSATETDMISLLARLRDMPEFKPFGPHHHPMVPGIILVVARNLGANVSLESIRIGLERGRMVPPASCSYLGVDGAAVGVGIAFSVIVKADPYKGRERHIAQTAVATALMRIADYAASRCCLRECVTALRTAEELSEELLGFKLPARGQITCKVQHLNKGCIGKRCPVNAYSGMDK